MKLAALLEKVDAVYLSGSGDAEIASVVQDSRKVTEGSLFICISGLESDGHRYIMQAVEAGAAAVLMERVPEEAEEAAAEGTCVFLQTTDTRVALAYISAAWFGYPADKMTMIGLTGTKGKTTTAHMIKSILEEAGYRTGMIGTVGAWIGEEKVPTINTTPEPYELHELFDKMYRAGCRFVVMEVSSQGLKQKRTLGITFACGAFLNISPDHIGRGEHADFAEYLMCKQMLFSQTGQAIANIDDEHWQEVTQAAEKVFTISARREADLSASQIQNLYSPGELGSVFKLSGKLKGDVRIHMPGRYNVENALAAIAAAYLMGISFSDILSGLQKVSVKGRTQVFRDPLHGSTLIIDYAHNALSMESLLQMLKGYEPARLICLFGGGGNRDRHRRTDMGRISGKYADLTIITMDNPRYEELKEINADIIRGLDESHGKYQIIEDRREAIQYAIDQSRKGDIIALIGKGHEEYQDVQGRKYYFSEEKIITEYLQAESQG